jgi:hypothetical protein
MQRPTAPRQLHERRGIFVTGRFNEEKDYTEENLRHEGYHDWDGLYMRDPSTDGQPVAIPKTAARNDIESRLGYT